MVLDPDSTPRDIETSGDKHCRFLRYLVQRLIRIYADDVAAEQKAESRQSLSDALHANQLKKSETISPPPLSSSHHS
jgi:hypothetical protein